MLEVCVARRPERTSQFERDPERAGRFGFFGLRANQADRNRREAFFLQIVSERAHGARADGSDGGEEDGIDLLLLQTAGELAGMGLHGDRIAGAHEGVVRVGE